jgi:carbon storage regulator
VLVLTRKVGEKVNIGDDIILSVLEIDRRSVRLGIDAPKSVTVFRQEIYERIKEENLKSARGASSDLLRAASLWKKTGFQETEH